jgi:hypothetical protein
MDLIAIGIPVTAAVLIFLVCCGYIIKKRRGQEHSVYSLPVTVNPSRATQNAFFLGVPMPAQK